jgi:hypothetical protein
MADYTISQLDTAQASKPLITDTIEAIANLGRNAACGFFNAYAAIVIPSPGTDFTDALWDGFCKNSSPGLPAAPIPSFSGGQCVGDAYKITFSFDVYQKSDNSLIQHVVNNTLTISGGPISAIRFNSGYDSSAVGIYVDFRNSTSGLPATTQQAYGSGSIDYAKNFSYSIANLTHPTDNCGSVTPHYPVITTPPTPTTPGGNTYNLPSVNVTFNNGFTTTVIPTLNLSAAFNPVIQIGGINISVGAGGVTVSPPGQTGTGGSSDPTALLNKILTNLGDGTIAGGGAGGAAAAAAKNTAPVPKPGGAGTQPPVPKPPTTPTVKGIPNLSSVQVFITTLPTTRDRIFAADSAYNVYIAGWFEWLQGDLVIGDRFPIQAQNTTWFAPKGSDGYTFTLTNGAAGYSQVSQTTS